MLLVDRRIVLSSNCLLLLTQRSSIKTPQSGLRNKRRKPLVHLGSAHALSCVKDL